MKKLNEMTESEALITMRKHIQEATELIEKAKQIANVHSFTFTVAASSYDGLKQDWVKQQDEEDNDRDYWQSSSYNC
jgi:phage protein D